MGEKQDESAQTDLEIANTALLEWPSVTHWRIKLGEVTLSKTREHDQHEFAKLRGRGIAQG